MNALRYPERFSILRPATIGLAGLLLLLLLGWSGLTGTSYAQTAARVGLVARAQVNPDAILLRWTPDTTLLWQQGIADGYFVERRTLTRSGGSVARGAWTRLTPTPVQPLPQGSPIWRAVATDSLMRSALYDPNPAAPASNTVTNVTVSASDLQYYRYVAALLASDADFTTAKAGGIAYVDVTVATGQEYEYRVLLASSGAGLTVASDIIPISLADFTGNRAIARPGLRFEFRQAQLSWPADTLRSGYYSYWIERSIDGVTFTPRNAYPFVSAGQNDSLFVYTDSLPAKRRLYYYRLRGKTIFGEEAVSPVVSGMAKDSALGPPVIKSARLLPTGEVRVSWRYPEAGTPRADSLVRGYRVEVARRPTDRPQPIAVGVAPLDTVYVGRGHQTRFPGSPTFYFWVVAERLDGDTLRSAPVFVEPLDTIPPTRPTGLRGTMLPDGKVQLDWNPNPEPDLKGYKVLRGQRVGEEATVISRDSIIPLPAWRDTVSLDLMNSQVVYRVQALDTHFNESLLSEPLVLTRPDTIPPAAPAFASGVASGAGIRLSWYPSVSRDVARYLLSRRDEPNGLWEKIDEINPADTVYTDPGVLSARRYGYLLIAVDKNGLQSDSTARISVEVTSRDGADKPVVGALTGQYDPTTGFIRLDWSYSGPPVSEFAIYRGSNGRPLSNWRMVAGGDRQTDDDFVKADTVYQYSIRATTKTGTTSDWLSTTVVFARTATSSAGDPPFVALPIPSATATVGLAVSLTVPNGTFADGSGSPVSVSILSAGLPTGLYAVGGLLRGVPTVGGNYTLTVRAVNTGGVSVTTPWVLLVNQPPKLLTAGLSHTVTVGESFTYVVPTTAFYDPSGTRSPVILANNLPADVTANGATLTGTLSAPGPFTLDVEVTDGDGAKTVVPLVLTGNRPPVLTTTPAPPVLLVGTAVSWSVSPGIMADPEGFSLVVEWLGGGLPVGVSVSGLKLLGIPQVPGSYTLVLRGTDVGGARLDYPVVLTVTTGGNQSPVVASLPTSPTITVGDPLSYTLSRDWFFDADGTIASLSITGGLPAGLTASAGGVLSGSLATPGVYSVSLVATDNSGATVQTVWTLVALAAPVVLPPAPTITNAGTLCSGSSTTLLAVGCTGLVRWSTGATGESLVVSPVVATTYSARCEVNNTQSLYAAPVTVQIGQLPASPTVASVTICPGSVASLTATGCAGQIQWSSGVTGAVLSVSGLTQTTTYSALCVSGGCSSTPTFATVTMGSGATATIAGNLSLCPGGSTTLIASGGQSYRWNTGGVALSATTAMLSVTATGVYNVTSIDGVGCTGLASVTVVESLPPALTLTSTAGLTLCPGAATTLVASGGVSYTWNTGGASLSATTPTLSVTQAGTYSVSATTAGGCRSTGSLTLVGGTSLSVTIAGTLTLCPGQSGTLLAGIGTVGETLTYRWSGGQTTASLPISASGVYSLTATSNLGCTGFASVTVGNSPALTVAIVGNTSLCAGGTTTLTATGGTTYAWSNSATTPTVSLSAVGVYSVTALNGAGCSATASVTLTNRPALTTTLTALPSQTICPGNSATLIASGGGTSAYRWNTGATSATVVVMPQSTTAYSVTITDGGSCTAGQSLTISTAPQTVAVGDLATDPLAAQVVFNLKAPGANLSQNNTFVDGSTNNLTVTRAGQITQGSFGPASGLGSAYFNGSGGLSIPHNAQTHTTGDFTWETWFYPTAQTPVGIALMTKGWPSPGAGGPLLYYNGNGQIVFYAGTDGSNWNVASNLPFGQAQLNIWQHVAVSRQGSTYRLFYNGVLVNTISNGANIFISGSPLTIGQGNTGANNLNGFLAGTRVSGNARYTANFTPPVSYSSDANTNVLLTYGNWGIQDVARRNNVETGGDARIITTQQPLGEAVVTFDGAGDYLRTAISPTYSLSTGDWTVDGWVYQTANGGDVSLFDTRANGEGIGLYTSLAGSPRRMGYANNTALLTTASVEIPLNVWTHVAWQRRNGTVTGYMNGRQVLSVGDTRTLAPMTSVVMGSSSNGASQFFTGSAYDLRLTKTARYSCDFTIPPTIAVLASQTVCAGQSTTLLASGGTSYSWNTGNTTASLVVSPTVTSVYTVTAQNPGSPAASTSVTIVVNTLPIVAVNSPTPDASVLFSLKASGGNLSQNNTFVDGSATNLPVTRTGGTSQGSFGPAPGLGSAYFNGSGGLSIPHNTQTHTTGDFTWETWFYPTAQTAGGVPLMTKGWPSPGAGGPLLYYNGSGQIVFYASTDGANWNVASNLLIGQAQLNTWQHVAVSRQGSTYRLFYNGVQVNTFTNPANIFISGSPLTIGQGNTGANNLNGFLAGTRVSGNARYTANFTPPISYSTDANTNLLLTYGNGGIQDVARKNVLETGGDARITTTQQPLGEAVVAFDGAGDYLRTAINPAYNLQTGDWTGNGDWTVDGWIYQTGNGGDVSLFDTRANGEGIGLYTSLASSPRRMGYANNAAVLTTASVEIPLNVWTHVAWQRRNGTVTGYMNGRQVLTVADTRTLAPMTSVVMGSLSNGASQFFTGNVYDLRLRKGAFYSCDFVVPPTLAVLPNQTICAGQSTTILASGGTSYQWSTGGVGTTSTLVVAPIITTTYTVVANITLPMGTFTASAGVTIVVNPLPIIALNSNTPDNTVLFSLKAPGANLAQNNTFVDGSANNLSVTRTGGTSQGNFGPSGLSGGYFNGSGGLSVPHNTQTHTTGDFTWETWFYPTAQTAGGVPLMTKGWPSPAAGGPLLYYNGSGQIVFYAGTDGANWNVASNLLIGQAQLNTWQHVAVSRQGNTYRLFYNGVQVNTISNGANIFISGSPLTIGQGNTGANNLNGFLAGTRVSGNARYTANFTPPTSYSSDANTNLLLTYGNGGIQDVARKNVLETGGDARITTTQQPLGEAVVTFDGAGDYLRTAINPIYNLQSGDWTGNGDWTVDGWVYQGNVSDTRCLIDTRAGGEGFALNTSRTGTARRLNYVNNLVVLATANVEIPVNTWTHVVLQRRGSIVTAYQNGQQVFSLSDTRTLAPQTNLMIGALYNLSGEFFQGSVYDLRLRKGAYYTCDFVVPPTLAVLPSQTICAGQTATIQASGGNSYVWNTGATTASISVSPTVTTTYSVTATSLNLTGNQTASTSVTIVVDALPVVAVNSATPDNTVLFSLKAPGANLSQNNTFVDESANTLSVTRTGGTSQGSFGPALGLGSAYFNGSGGLSISHNAQTHTTGDFTWETWFYPTAQTAGGVPLMTKGWPSPGAGGPLLYYNGSGQIVFYASTDGANWNVASNLLLGQAQLNTWQHVAVSRQGSTYRLFYNGVQVNTISSSANIFISGSPLTIGQGNTGANNLNGFLAGTRVSGNARYIANFTPPVSYVSDANTNLLLNYNNVAVRDVTNRNNLETGGDVRVTSTMQPLGQHVVAFDGAGDYLRTAINPAYNLRTGDWSGNGDWTVDGWVYQGNVSDTRCLIDTRSGGEGFALNTSRTGTARRLNYVNNSVVLATANVEIPVNQWTHIALQRRGGIVTAYQNGKQVFSLNDTRTLAPSTNLVVGALYNLSGEFFVGSVYDLRLRKGAYYTCDFVVPPTIAVLSSQTICAGQSTTLIASGGNSYVWSTGGAGLPATTPSIVVNPTGTTSYSVVATVTLPNGSFTASTGVTVTVNVLPVVSANSATPDNTVLFSLKAPGANLSQNHTFVDGSPNNLSVTRTGGTSQGSFGPTTGLSSAYFNGSGGLSVPHNTQTHTTGDFTWETWFYPTAQTAGGVPLMTKGWPSPGAGGPLLYYNGNGQIVFYAGTDGYNWNVASNLLIGQAKLNTWQHVAISRQGSTYRLFYNGVQVNTISNAANIFISGSPLTIGQGNTGGNNLNGFLAGTRVSGNARYTANFTPPTSYSNDASTNLLLAYGNWGIQDVARRNVLETGGSARVSTVQQPLGQNVVTFNGSTDYLRTAISPHYSLGLGDWTGNGDWTVDGWVYQGNVSDTRCLIDTRAGGEGFALNTSRTGTARRLNYVNNSAVLATANVEIPVNTWTHVVLQRRGSIVTAYQNGQQVFSLSDTRTLAPQTSLVIGALYNLSSEFFQGSLFDLRLRKGAYYDCNFVVPVVP